MTTKCIVAGVLNRILEQKRNVRSKLGNINTVWALVNNDLSILVC